MFGEGIENAEFFDVFRSWEEMFEAHKVNFLNPKNPKTPQNWLFAVAGPRPLLYRLKHFHCRVVGDS